MKKKLGLLGGLIGIILAVAIWAGVLQYSGGQPGSAETLRPDREAAAAAAKEPSVDVAAHLHQISSAIPIYPNARYRPDLSRRDLVNVSNNYGADAEIYTLASENSFPQIYYYYVNNLSQYRAWNPPDPYPSSNERWRAAEFDLKDVMVEPFIPGNSMENANRRVILQIVETESEPKTVIRYIVVPLESGGPTTPVADVSGVSGNGRGAENAAR